MQNLVIANNTVLIRWLITMNFGCCLSLKHVLPHTHKHSHKMLWQVEKAWGTYCHQTPLCVLMSQTDSLPAQRLLFSTLKSRSESSERWHPRIQVGADWCLRSNLVSLLRIQQRHSWSNQSSLRYAEGKSMQRARLSSLSWRIISIYYHLGLIFVVLALLYWL